jgi:hypothetical protein
MQGESRRLARLRQCQQTGGTRLMARNRGGEAPWAGHISTGDPPGPAFYVHLELLELSVTSTRRMREQASMVLVRYADSERAVIINLFRSVVDACDRRLALFPGHPNTWLIPRCAPPD